MIASAWQWSKRKKIWVNRSRESAMIWLYNHNKTKHNKLFAVLMGYAVIIPHHITQLISWSEMWTGFTTLQSYSRDEKFPTRTITVICCKLISKDCEIEYEIFIWLMSNSGVWPLGDKSIKNMTFGAIFRHIGYCLLPLKILWGLEMLKTHSGRQKWPKFSRRHFQMHFLEWESSYFDLNFTEVCCNG